jgi:3-oxoadipate enol-lactonase
MRDQRTNAKGPLHWVQTGTDHPETVVLIHAVGYDLTYWDRQIEALCGNYNVSIVS